MASRLGRVPWILDTALDETPNLAHDTALATTTATPLKLDKVTLENNAGVAGTFVLLEELGGVEAIRKTVPAGESEDILFGGSWVNGFHLDSLPGGGSRVLVYPSSPIVSVGSRHR